jgi:hypothetical protein
MKQSLFSANMLHTTFIISFFETFQSSISINYEISSLYYFVLRKCDYRSLFGEKLFGLLFIEVANQNFKEHPFAGYYLRTGDGTARFLSDFVTENQLYCLEGLYQQYLRPLGIEDQMLMVLPNTLGASREETYARQQQDNIVISIHRPQRDFTERDRLILNLIRPHLIQAYVYYFVPPNNL